jgi:hypothetical protein
MYQTVHRFKKLYFYSAALISLIVSLFIVHITHAVPGYSDDYQTTSSVKTGATSYYGINCTQNDISNNWHQYILDPSTWVNPGDATNPSSANYQAKASFQKALNGGRWGVSQYVEPGGGGYAENVLVYWSEDNSLKLNWFSESAYAAWNPGGQVYSMFIGCRKNVVGGFSSDPVAWAYSGGGSSISISNDTPISPVPASGPAAIASYLLYTDYPDYPSGYSGSTISFNPPGGTVQGDTHCPGIVTNVRINAPTGFSGDADLTDDGLGLGGKLYSYYLWGGVPYSLAVTCDGEDVYFGPTVSTNPYGTYNWACAPLGEQNYCAAM